jgi:SPP1 family predicted phage head-tail adaptor
MTAATIDPGALRHRLTLQAPVETPDGAGGVARNYATVATLWAAVTPVLAQGTVEADAFASSVTHRITIRARGDVSTRHRLCEGTRIFRIVATRDPDGTGRFTEIHAEERVA